jgi:hypothetical protein
MGTNGKKEAGETTDKNSAPQAQLSYHRGDCFSRAANIRFGFLVT